MTLTLIDLGFLRLFLLFCQFCLDSHGHRRRLGGHTPV